jgi:hypothetical protein
MSQREQTYQISVSGDTLSLEDLRWIVKQTSGFKGTSKVHLTAYSDQRDGDYAKIVIDGEPDDLKPGVAYRVPEIIFNKEYR